MSKGIFFVAAPASGHVNPALPLVSELVRRDHRVGFASGPGYVGSASAAGATTVVLPWTLDPSALTHDQFSTASLVGLLDGLLEAASPCMNALVEAARADGTDLVCFDAMVSPFGLALAERLGVPAVSLMPNMAVNQHSPVADLLPSDFEPTNEVLAAYAGRLHDFGVRNGLVRPLLPMAAPDVPLTVVFVPFAFQIAAETFDRDKFRFVGPTLSSGDSGWSAPTDDRPLLLVSLGTAFNDRPHVFRACADAFADMEWRVVMSVGRTSRAELGAVADNIVVADSVPQQAILRRASAFVSHAGMNSIMESLSFGVPLIMVPQVPEQSVNARRVAELGLGTVLNSEDVNPSDVRDAVGKVVSDESVRDRLDWMAGELAAAGGAVAAADAILSLLA